MPLVHCDVLQGLAYLANGATGNVDQDVDATVASRGFFDEGIDRFSVRDVGDGGVDAAAILGHGGCDGLTKNVGENVAGPDVGAVGGELMDDGASDAVGGAGDEGCFAGEFNVHAG